MEKKKMNADEFERMLQAAWSWQKEQMEKQCPSADGQRRKADRRAAAFGCQRRQACHRAVWRTAVVVVLLTMPLTALVAAPAYYAQPVPEGAIMSPGADHAVTIGCINFMIQNL